MGVTLSPGEHLLSDGEACLDVSGDVAKGGDTGRAVGGAYHGQPPDILLRNVVQGEAMESLAESLITSLDICSPTVEDSRFSILHTILFLD